MPRLDSRESLALTGVVPASSQDGRGPAVRGTLRDDRYAVQLWHYHHARSKTNPAHLLGSIRHQ
jgi:hypothetical protein